ncbi:MAG TPA: respiratory nitrate reductase subunit gamma, partial [Thermopolyspora sp.]
MNALDVALFVIAPYIAITTFVLGHVWRYRYDKFGWTTRSSQMYESRLLRIGSPLFHFGILLVLIGHVAGLVIPNTWTEAVGITEDMYHPVAVVVGSAAGFCTLAGL